MAAGAEQRQARRRRGFEPAGALVARDIRSVGERRGFAVARLLTHWAEIAGPEIASRCMPLSVTAPRGKGGLGATLTLLARGAEAPRLAMQEPLIRDRINAAYGYAAIARIRITQTAATGLPGGMAEPGAPFAHAPAAPRPEPDPPTRAAARSLADGVGDPDLRRALSALGAQVLARRARKTPHDPDTKP